MRIRANRNRVTMLKFMAGKERSRTEGSVECKIEEERARKDMVNDKESTLKNTLEEMLQKYVTEIEKLREEMKQEGETQMGKGERTARRKNNYFGTERGKEEKAKQEKKNNNNGCEMGGVGEEFSRR